MSTSRYSSSISRGSESSSISMCVLLGYLSSRIFSSSSCETATWASFPSMTLPSPRRGGLTASGSRTTRPRSPSVGALAVGPPEQAPRVLGAGVRLERPVPGEHLAQDGGGFRAEPLDRGAPVLGLVVRGVHERVVPPISGRDAAHPASAHRGPHRVVITRSGVPQPGRVLGPTSYAPETSFGATARRAGP